eukprot:TRINITY_DN6207_c0_g1_i2.p1 TRINITY_DN6207_c0_g1~~TRINITY_DN6207_c0_g1_i2.p1  ORF type:complete len:342 (+),score=88.06 TRINITY_DN6207_c0_g1_i2:92-1027(+)
MHAADSDSSGDDKPPIVLPGGAVSGDGSGSRPSAVHKQYLWKLLLVGDDGVGKSCILRRIVGEDPPKVYHCTIGVDFKIRTLDTKPPIKLQIWDTAGQERFRTITTAYYRGAHAVLLVFDVTKMQSFDNLKIWLAQVKQYAKEDVIQVIVGNKTDLSAREVPYETAKGFAASLGVPYVECSAQSDQNVEQALMMVVTMLKRTVQVPVLLVGGQELSSDRLDCPLSELGISAEGRVEVLDADPARDVKPAAEGGLTIYVTAPSLGLSDAVAFEVDPAATVGSLLSAFRERYVAPAEHEQGGGGKAPAAGGAQ